LPAFSSQFSLRGDFDRLPLRRSHSQRKVEIFYWTVLLVSNTLGTALGDHLADSSGLGYAVSNGIISSGIAVIVLACLFTSISRTTLFWGAALLAILLLLMLATMRYDRRRLGAWDWVRRSAAARSLGRDQWRPFE
jgi:uncharacterized membrane-anchored protein